MPEGKLFTLLGPSGCGKTTTLRSIAGLEKPTSGEIEVAGRAVYSSSRGIFVAPNKRNFGMVFQSYAIWPHMNVFQNVAFPLEVRKLGKREIEQKVMRVLTAVQLDHLVERDATKLSGGQQQRLALARALVMEPQLLLLDEPLSNLDAKLRDAMRTELKRLQREFNLTTVYVTHDQSEALSLSHEIAVMSDGRIVQVGTPRADLRAAHQPVRRRFRRPDQFRRRHRDRARRRRPLPGQDRARRAQGRWPPTGSRRMPRWWYRCARRTWSCPSRNFRPGADENVIRATVHAKDFLGEYLDFHVKVGDVVLQARAHPSLRTPTGDPIFVRMRAEKCVAIRTDADMPAPGGGVRGPDIGRYAQ